MITFNQDRPIYLQISDRICDEILAGKYAADQRIPSVRDYAAFLQVNTNTAVKAYEDLSRKEIIYQRRGMGYFVSAGAYDAITKDRQVQFKEMSRKQLFRDMDLLGITIDDVVKEYNEWKGQKG